MPVLTKAKRLLMITPFNSPLGALEIEPPNEWSHASFLTRQASSPNLSAMSERESILTKPDPTLEITLRPSLFSDFTGQAKVKERLEIAVEAAKQRKEPL